MKDVMLKIIGKQLGVDGEENKIEFASEGKFYKKNGAYYIVYNESEISGMQGSTTTLKVQDSKVQMKRYGTNTSKLVFEKGQKHISPYITECGEMLMEVVTHKLDKEINEEGKGKIDIGYRLNISNIAQSNNTISIEIM